MENIQTLSGLSSDSFQAEIDGKQTNLYVMRNKLGAELSVCNYGAKIVSLMVPGKNGKLTDSLSYYPAKPDGVSDFTHALACVGTLAVEENGKHFARALAYDGGIDFFGVDNGRLCHISRYERFGMDYDVLDVGQQVPTLSPTTRVGFSDPAVSTRRYYVLYSEELGRKPARFARSTWKDGLCASISWTVEFLL